MQKLAYPTTRPFTKSYDPKSLYYKVTRSSKFYKALLDMRLRELPIKEIEVYSHCYYSNETIDFKGTAHELLQNNNLALGVAYRLVQHFDRWQKGPMQISTLPDGSAITGFFGGGESSNQKFIITWEAV